MFAHVISQVPEGAPVDLLCEECERRHAVAKCEECNEVLCPLCLAILHIPSAGGQAHPDLAQARSPVLSQIVQVFCRIDICFGYEQTISRFDVPY